MPAQPQELDAQKAALVAAIAQQGSVGQQAFIAEQARRQQAQQQAVQAIADQSKMTGSAGPAPRRFTQGLQAQQAALGNVYAQDAAMSQQSYANSIANTQAAGASYMDAARAAVPVVNAQTAGTVAQIRAEQQAAAEQRAYEAEQRRQEAAWNAEERAFQREKMQFERDSWTQGTNDEEEQKKQAGILVRAGAGPGGNTAQQLMADIVKDAPDFRTAVVGMNSYIKAAQANGEPWSDAATQDLIRSLYNFYNVDTGKTAPKDKNALGDLLHSENLDPRRVPGYTPMEGTFRRYAEGEAWTPQAVAGVRPLNNGPIKGKYDPKKGKGYTGIFARRVKGGSRPYLPGYNGG